MTSTIMTSNPFCRSTPPPFTSSWILLFKSGAKGKMARHTRFDFREKLQNQLDNILSCTLESQ